MKKITYIFGAGASRNALPIVGEIPIRILKLIEFLENEDLSLESDLSFDFPNGNTKSKREWQLEMIDALKWALQASQKHASVDTFAKKLFIKDQFDELKRLKVALSVFFIFEQIRSKPDFRYDAFFASLLNENIHDLPENVRISWNYDYQFELSFSEYTGSTDIKQNQEKLRVYTKHGNEHARGGFGIYKLNGTTGLQHDNGRIYLYSPSLTTAIDRSFVEQITKSYITATYQKGTTPALSFAWERDFGGDIVAKAVEKTKDTSVLIVIGYSFPFFNRTIDRQIIGSMDQLSKVYFQSPDADTVKERFQALKDNLSGIQLVPKYDVDQFLLPFEL